jgi:heme-degrading monooxygenase HmoA
MIARIWRGWTPPQTADAYVDYLQRTGIAGYLATPGNRGAWILRRQQGDRVEFVTLSFWNSFDDIRGFAGDDIEKAVFYPDDEQFLAEGETTVDHYELIESEGTIADPRTT